MMYRILVVDDEKNMRELLKDLLSLEGFAVEAVADGETALAKAREQAPDLMVLDLRLPGLSGQEVLKTLRAEAASFPVIVITAHGDLAAAVETLKAGAADFIVKPFDNARLLASVRQALESRGLVRELEYSRPKLSGDAPELLGQSPGIGAIQALIDKVAATDATVLIRGESGTGKELVARAIHLRGPRRDAPMISINCAALPDTLLESELFGYERGAFTGAHQRKPGKLELADGGTVFLDEIGDLSLSAQAKLLRVLEEKKVSPLGGAKSHEIDIRVIAATNRDLEAMIKTQAFREDLFFRLDVVQITLPPLRDRKEDIPLLARRFLEKFKRQHRRPDLELDPPTLDRLLAYAWPGNIRELEHCLEKFVILGSPPPQSGPTAIASPTPSASPGPIAPLKDAIRAAEREAIIRALQHTAGNKTEAARLLQISYKTLFNKIRELEISIRAEIE